METPAGALRLSIVGLRLNEVKQMAKRPRTRRISGAVPGAIIVCVLGCLLSTGAALAGPATAPSGEVRWRELPNTDTVFPPPSFDSLDAWKARRAELIEQVRFAAGLWPEPQPTLLNARVFGKLDRGDYTIEKVYFESRPGFLVTGNLYRPAYVEGKVPAIACPHGHWEHGRLENTDKCSVPARCIMLARLGAVVFSYDMVGYNDSKRQLDHNDPRLLNPASNLWGIGPLQLQAFNGVRVLDFLQSLPEVDPKRIGVTGASGGGTQTFILTAVDDRVSAAAPVNMISSIMQGGCNCENAPALRIDTNNMEIGALAAPRPLLMVSATGDWTKNTPQVEFPAIRRIYDLYGDADRIANVHVDAPHNYNLQTREAVYRFMARWLLKRADTDTIKEHDIQVDKDEDLLVFADGKTPECMWPFDKVIDRIKHDATAQIDALRPTSMQKLEELTRIVTVGLKHAVGSDWPKPGEVRRMDQPASQAAGDPSRVRLACVRRDRPVPELAITGGGAAGAAPVHRVFCVAPEGLAAADKHADFAAALGKLGSSIAFVGPFGTGPNLTDPNAKPPRGSTKFFTTFNRTDTAETIFDLLTVLADAGMEPYSKASRDHNVNDSRSTRTTRLACSRGNHTSYSCATPERGMGLVAFGRLGPAALAARAMVPAEVVRKTHLRTVIDMNGFDGDSDEAYLKDLNLPNIRKIGGLEALVAAAANGPIWFHNVGPNVPADWADQAGKLNTTKVKITRDRASDEAVADYLAGG